MSRTDAHRPWWVKEKQSNNWWIEMISTQQCGCRMCTNYYGRRKARRVERMRERLMLKNIRKIRPNAIEGEDSYVAPRQAWS